MNIAIFLDEVTAYNGALMDIPRSRKHGVIEAGVNGGAKRDHLGGVRRDRLAAAGLSP